MYALEHRRELSGRWSWMLASGIIDLFLAIIILAGMPGSAAWALGMLVGINMLFGGSAMMGMALHAHREPTAPQSTARDPSDATTRGTFDRTDTASELNQRRDP